MLSSHKNDSEIRKRQIDTLKIFNHNVIIIKENEEYSINFLTGDREITIKIILGAEFPNEKPKLIINPIVNHSWVNNNSGEIDSPGLANYTIHSDLGRIVQAIIREFEKYPPQFRDEPKSPKEMKNIPSPKNSSNKGIYDLSVLSIQDLTLMNEDTDYLDGFIEKLACIQNLYEDLNNLVLQVESLACTNITKKEQIEENQQRLEEMFSEFKELGIKYEESSQKYQKKAQDFSPHNIKLLLQIAVANSDSICEKEAQKFLTGEIDVTSFLQTFMEAKKLSSMRKAKEERLSHQLHALEKTQTFGNFG